MVLHDLRLTWCFFLRGSIFTNSSLVSPGPLSPVSTISNGGAPTIPDAPMSDFEEVDYFRGTYQAPQNRNRARTPTSANPNAYAKEYTPALTAINSQRPLSPYGHKNPKSHSPYRESSPPQRGRNPSQSRAYDRRSYSGPDAAPHQTTSPHNTLAGRRSYSSPHDAHERRTVENHGTGPTNYGQQHPGAYGSNPNFISSGGQVNGERQPYYEHVRSPLQSRRNTENYGAPKQMQQQQPTGRGGNTYYGGPHGNNQPPKQQRYEETKYQL